MKNEEPLLYKTVSASDRLLITFVVMAATLMQVIDTTIVNVALPHMQGSLGASSDEITWTLTSYLVASAIFMPLTGYLSDIFGRKKYLIISITGFTIVSALCGASVSLTQIVFFRMLQGVFGAGLVPLSQAILTDIYPPSDRGKAMAIWGVGVMVGPILGPTLGGYLTDVLNWRWTFYVNVPVGAMTLLLINIIPQSKTIKRSMDWLGLILISISIGGIQFVLDRGNTEDWFSATSICVITYLVVASFFLFVLHNMGERKNTSNVFDLALFRDRNFGISCILLGIFGLGLYGMMVIAPLMMEGILNYPALTAGLMMAPRGISGMISMMIIGKLINYVDPRALIISGALICIYGISIGTGYSINNISPFWLIWPMIWQGFGLGMVMVPLSTVAFSTLPISSRTEAAGIFSLLRTMGGSIGISIAITLSTRRAQVFWNDLGGFINPYQSSVAQYLQGLHTTVTNPKGALIIGNLIGQQAQMLAYINVYKFITWCFLIIIPLALLLNRGRVTQSAAELLE